MPPVQLNRDVRRATALEYLTRLVDEGVEFPEACSRAASAFKVDYDALRGAYDAQEEEGHHG